MLLVKTLSRGLLYKPPIHHKGFSTPCIIVEEISKRDTNLFETTTTTTLCPISHRRLASRTYFNSSTRVSAYGVLERKYHKVESFFILY